VPRRAGRGETKVAARRKPHMKTYRSPMEKILKQLEDDLVITNPKERGKAFRLKIIYRCAYWVDRIGKFFRRDRGTRIPL
jgi:hypothetical protein